MKQRNMKLDATVIGLALFAMFFGAGNLIFPPYLGMESGNKWFLGFLLFIIADIGLAFVAIILMSRGEGTCDGIMGVLGKKAAFILNTAIIVCVGPLLAVPRTAATTYEMMVCPIVSGVNTWIFSVVFFGITLLLTIKPTKVMDIIGEFLTPVMVVALIVLIVAGVAHPLGDIAYPVINSVVSEGIMNGYQAMDIFGAFCFAMVIYTTIKSKGYTEKKDRVKITSIACLIAGALLFMIYCGLAYLGATYSNTGNLALLNQAGLIIAITKALLGRSGVLMLGLIVGLACLTTSIGLTSASAAYFEKITKGRLKYTASVVVICIFSMVVSNFGLSTIISFAAPVLCIINPIVTCLIIMYMFNDRLSNHNIYKGAILVVLVVSVLTVGESYGLPFGFINYLPLAAYQLNWVLPAAIGGLVGACIKPDIKLKSGNGFKMRASSQALYK